MANPILDKLKNVFSNGTANLIEKAGDAIDKVFTNKEERDLAKLELEKAIHDHTQKMAENTLKHFEAEIKDMADARSSNVKIQESANASWLSKNVGYIMDLGIGAVWSALTIVIILKAFKLVGSDVDWATVLSVYSTVTAVFMTCLNFHRSSSSGSKQKDDRLDKMMNK